MKVIPSATFLKAKDDTLLTNPKVSEKYEGVKDAELWNAFTDGDEEAFIKIYNDYFEELCNFGVQFAPLTVVKDAIQDLFIHLRNKRTNLPPIKNSIKLFLFQCLKRRLFNVKKKESKKIRNLPEDVFEIVISQESAIILSDQHKLQVEKLNKALAKLNAKQREAIYYYFYKGMSYQDVQELMEFDNIKSARNLIYKVIKKLKKNFLFFF